VNIADNFKSAYCIFMMIICICC